MNNPIRFRKNISAFLITLSSLIFVFIMSVLPLQSKADQTDPTSILTRFHPSVNPYVTLINPLTGEEFTVTPETSATSLTQEQPLTGNSDEEQTVTSSPTLTFTIDPNLMLTETLTLTPTETLTITPTETATASETPTETATAVNEETTWNVEVLVQVPNQEVRAEGGVESAETQIENEVDTNIVDNSVEAEVESAAVTSTVTKFKISVAGEDGLDQFRETIFGDLGEQIDLLGGAITLEINGDVKAGEAFPLLLESNPSTGFIWQIISYDANLLQIINESEFDQKYITVGSPSVQTIKFLGINDGTTTITLFYGRPWLSQAPTSKITVDAGANLTVENLDMSAPVDEAQSSQSLESGLEVVDPSTETSIVSTTFDWRNKDGSNFLTSVRNQGSCGSCWAFATVGVFESAIKIQGGGNVDLSEQYLVSCNSSGYSCSGGWWAHTYHINRYISPQTEAGAVLESALPYTATNGSCSTSFSHPYKLANWYSIAGDWTVPSVDQIKAAITQYGPVASAICVGSGFSSYSGGVFTTNETSACNGGVNHAILLVGWDDATQSWILRNSWGPYWGESGYMRIRWGTSNVGYAANYVVYTGGATPTPGPTPTNTATVQPAVNDNFDNPATVALVNNAYTTSEDISGSTRAYDDPTFTCTSNIGYKSVWFKFIPASSGTLAVNTIGSNYDTILGIWQGNRGSLSSIACDDDSGGSYTSSITALSVTAGQTYFIEVASYNNVTSGTLNFNVSFQPAPTATPTFTATPTLFPIDNIAVGKSVSQSSDPYSGPATRAVDGNTDGNWANNSVSHTGLEAQAWWQLDLGASYTLETLRIWNRTDCCSERLSNYYVLVSDTPFTSTNLNTTLNQAGVSNYFISGENGYTRDITVNRSGRYIRVQLSGTGYLSMAEVQIAGQPVPTATPTLTYTPTLTNTPMPPSATPTITPTPAPFDSIAIGKTASQSSNPYDGPATRAVDGNTDGNWANNSVSHTGLESQPWWQVDLGSVYSLSTINIWNRTDCCSDRLSNYYVLVSDNPFTSTNLSATLNQAGVTSYYVSGISGQTREIAINRSGRYIRVQLSGTGYLSMAEVEVDGQQLPTSTLTLTNTPTATPTLTLTPTITNTPLPATATPLFTSTSVPSSNIAAGKTASQSSNPFDGPATRAVDGNTDGNWANNSVSHTGLESQAWWQVDLGAPYSLQTINIWNRTDCCSDRLSNYYVLVSDTPFTSTNLSATLNQAGVTSYFVSGESGLTREITINRSGRYIRVQLSGAGYLSMAEVEVTGQPVPTATPTLTNTPTATPTLTLTPTITNTPLPATATPLFTSTSAPSSNIAAGKAASQSSNPYGGPATRAVDGNTDGNWANNSVSHTGLESQAWWQVDLGALYSLQTINIWNRTDCCSDRLSNYYVLVSDNPFTSTNLNTTLNQAGVTGYFVSGESGLTREITINRSGRYIRVQLSGAGYLSMAEVEVTGQPMPTATPTLTNTPTATPTITPTIDPSSNIAAGKAASQSSNPFGGPATRAVDGNTDGNWANNSVSHTGLESQAWWQVDLGAVSSLGTATIWNRTDCCSTRLSNYYVLVSDTPFTSTNLNTTLNQAGVTSYFVSGESGLTREIAINRSGRYIRVQLSGTGYLSMAEFQVGIR